MQLILLTNHRNWLVCNHSDLEEFNQGASQFVKNYKLSFKIKSLIVKIQDSVRYLTTSVPLTVEFVV